MPQYDFLSLTRVPYCVFPAGLAGVKMTKRTEGIVEFEFKVLNRVNYVPGTRLDSDTAAEADGGGAGAGAADEDAHRQASGGLPVFIFVSGFLRSRGGHQKPWGWCPEYTCVLREKGSLGLGVIEHGYAMEDKGSSMGRKLSSALQLSPDPKDQGTPVKMGSPRWKNGTTYPGIVVRRVEPKGAAALAGIEQGSLILSVGGVLVTSVDQFVDMVSPDLRPVNIQLLSAEGFADMVYMAEDSDDEEEPTSNHAKEGGAAAAAEPVAESAVAESAAAAAESETQPEAGSVVDGTPSSAQAEAQQEAAPEESTRAGRALSVSVDDGVPSSPPAQRDDYDSDYSDSDDDDFQETNWPLMNGEQHVLLWQSDVLREIGKKMRWVGGQEVAEFAAKEALKTTMLAGIIAATLWPVALLKAADAIDNPWSIAFQNALDAGKMLAETLMARPHGSRPVTLVGFSLGALLVSSCLRTLFKSGAKGLGIVENAVLLGSAMNAKKSRWSEMRQVVAGRLINGYADSDWILRFLFRMQSYEISIAGLAPVPVLGVENVDVSGIVKGHMDYSKPGKMARIFELLELE